MPHVLQQWSILARRLNVKQYETPELTEVGTFETITKAATTGSQLDGTFPRGTPGSELTFSD